MLGIGVLVFVITAIIAVRLQLRVAAVQGPIGFDEGYAAAFGVRMVEGRWLPYVDAISHRGPMLYWVVALATTIAGPYSWDGIRWLGLTAFLATFGALFVAGVAARRPLAGAAAATIYAFMICCALHFSDGVSVRGEQIAAPFTILSLICVTVGIERARSARAATLWLVCAGGLAACAGFGKQTLMPCIGVLALWPAAVAWSRRDTSPRRRWLTALSPIAGWVLVVLIVLTPYALAGELGSFWYWFWRYNTEIYIAPFLARSLRDQITHGLLFGQPWAVLGAVLVLSSTLGAAVSTLSGWRTRDVAGNYARNGFALTAGLGAAIILAVTMAGRIWPHYFVVALAWFALALGLSLERSLWITGAQHHLAATLATFTFLLLFVGAAVDRRVIQFAAERRGGGWADAKGDPICEPLERHSRPLDPIFVWGFDPDIYITCRRRPASRFLFTTMVAGSVPGANEPPRKEWIAKGAPEMLKDDLVTARPSVILDLTGFVQGSITHVEALKPWFEREYCRVEDVTGRGGRTAGVFLRRDNHGKACAATTPAALAPARQGVTAGKP